MQRDILVTLVEAIFKLIKVQRKTVTETKWCQISVNCFYFSEQRFPHICVKVPIATVQHFILSIPDYRHFNFQRFRHSSTIVPIFNRESFRVWLVWSVETVLASLFVFGCSRRWTVTFDALLLVLCWSTIDFLFSFTIIALHEYFISYTLGWQFGISLHLFFYYFCIDFCYPKKGNCLLFVSIIIVVDITWYLFSQNIKIFCFKPQLFFRTNLGSSCKKSFEYTGDWNRGYWNVA